MKKYLILTWVLLLMASLSSVAFAGEYLVKAGDVLWKIASDINEPFFLEGMGLSTSSFLDFF